MARSNIRVSGKAALLACSALAAIATSGQAFAADEETGVADIVVTAQKREQSMQDVPVAVTALSTEALKANRVTSLLDLSSQAPNLAVRTTLGGLQTPTYTMRGSLTYGSVTGQDKTIALYQDGVYIGFAQGSGFDFPELERIEVLRGPQGTLFGRNSTAGAISIVTRDPKGEFGVKQQFTVGNYSQLRSSTTIDTPAWGPFSAMVNYSHFQRNGEVKNLGPFFEFDHSLANSGSLARTKLGKTTVKRLGDKNNESIFVAVKFEPSDRFKAVYKFDYNQSDFTPEANYLLDVIPAFFGDFNPATVDFGDVLTSLYNSQPLVEAGARHRAKAVYNGFTTQAYMKNLGHNLTATWKLSDDVTVKNVLGYRKNGGIAQVEIGGHTTRITQAAADILAASAGFPSGSFNSLVGGVLPFFGGINEFAASQWSDEVQVNYESEPLTLTAGGIYFKIKTSDSAPPNLTGQYFTTPVALSLPATGTKTIIGFPGGKLQRNYFSGQSMAAYAQAEVHITPQLDVIGGFRVTYDKKSGVSYLLAANDRCVRASNGTLYTNAGVLTCDVGDTVNPLWRAAKGSQLALPASYRDTKSTYMLGVNYKPNDDLLLFAKYSTGFMSGGNVAGKDYEPETVKAWEAGIKADLFDRRLRANLALFYNKFKNLQYVSGGRFLPVKDFDLGTLILREGDFRSKGFELELTAVPVDRLTLGGSVGYASTNLSNVNPLIRNTDEPLTRPKWTANFSAQYDTQPLFGDAFMTFRLDGNYRTKSQQSQSHVRTNASFQPIFNDKLPFTGGWAEAAYSDAMLLINGRIALRDINIAGAKAEVALWGRNLTNQIRPGQGVDFTVGMVTSYTQARTYGLDVNFEF